MKIQKSERAIYQLNIILKSSESNRRRNFRSNFCTILELLIKITAYLGDRPSLCSVASTEQNSTGEPSWLL